MLNKPIKQGYKIFALAVTALVADRNRHPQTNLALDDLGICFTDALYTLCGQALQASLACDLRTT